ncbi:hypothetical protein [Cognatishimia maritima]|uniref:Uncharacterized protein n=1 Tax=Cognatishimia maritima TaxID=870908 RepID=A0A1M5MU69_9RHOB|nr:hypothetical protein [Cognatishimia maritima]SHG80745.1 hypothetical protein SAMN04488044_1332 [Cognatishimia maritima]
MSRASPRARLLGDLRADWDIELGFSMKDQDEELSHPAPMLDRELSQDTLLAIKAIVQGKEPVIPKSSNPPPPPPLAAPPVHGVSNHKRPAWQAKQEGARFAPKEPASLRPPEPQPVSEVTVAEKTAPKPAPQKPAPQKPAAAALPETGVPADDLLHSASQKPVSLDSKGNETPEPQPKPRLKAKPSTDRNVVLDVVPHEGALVAGPLLPSDTAIQEEPRDDADEATASEPLADNQADVSGPVSVTETFSEVPLHTETDHPETTSVEVAEPAKPGSAQDDGQEVKFETVDDQGDWGFDIAEFEACVDSQSEPEPEPEPEVQLDLAPEVEIVPESEVETAHNSTAVAENAAEPEPNPVENSESEAAPADEFETSSAELLKPEPETVETAETTTVIEPQVVEAPRAPEDAAPDDIKNVSDLAANNFGEFEDQSVSDAETAEKAIFAAAEVIEEPANNAQRANIPTSDAGSDAEIEDAVHGLIAEHPALDEEKPSITDTEKAGQETLATENVEATVSAVLTEDKIKVKKPSRLSLFVSRQARRLWAKILQIIPDDETLIRVCTPRRVAVALILFSVIIEPWFFPTVLVLALFFGSLIGILMGPDRIHHYAELGWKRYERKRPEKALELRNKAMDRLERWQAVADRLPSRWTQGLHLPQFQTDEERAAAECAYANRMARIAREESRKSYS